MSTPLTTRQERLDIACAVGIVAILLLLAGFWLHGIMYPTPAAAAEPPAIVATVASDDYDPDEGERIDAAELAELNAPATPEEDEPGWDCSTMGNKVCGPLPPCATEDDQTPCYWDAATRGNGQGRSFIWTGSQLIYTS